MSMKILQGKEKAALYHIEAQEAQNQEYGSKYILLILKNIYAKPQLQSILIALILFFKYEWNLMAFP